MGCKDILKVHEQIDKTKPDSKASKVSKAVRATFQKAEITKDYVNEWGPNTSSPRASSIIKNLCRNCLYNATLLAQKSNERGEATTGEISPYLLAVLKGYDKLPASG